MHHRVLFLLISLFTLLNVRAESVTVQKHSYEKTLEADGRTWTLTGTGFYKHKGLFAVFTAALYETEDGRGRKLVFTYCRTLKGDVLREQGLRVLREAHGEAALTERKNFLEAVSAAYQTVQEGDQYMLTVLPEDGMRLALNGAESVYIPDATFGLWYLGIWLGEKPMSESLRNELLNRGKS
jgi:hypothetical protein